jgi:hypothetical protein
VNLVDMATRRALLRLAGAAAGAVAGASALGACAPRRGDRTDETIRPGAYLIFITTQAGASVLDQDGRVVTPPTVVAVATPDWRHAVTARPAGDDTRVAVEDLATRRVAATHTIPGRFEPRAVSPAGDLIASVPPGGAGVYGLHQPGGRERTTLVVSGRDGERVRLDLAGNIEPYAFAPAGDALFVHDFTPAPRPRRFAVRVVDLAAGRVLPVAVGGGDEHMRAYRVDDVLDPRRGRLFSLYSWPDETVAFVGCVDLRERWTRRIDLPAPFGQERPGVHAIALSPAGDRLCVVHSPSAGVAEIDPDRLAVRRVTTFAATGQEGKPNVAFTASGRLVVNVDRRVMATDPTREIPTPGEARGLVVRGDTEVWAGHPDGVVRLDLATGRALARLAVPDLYIVKHVRPA